MSEVRRVKLVLVGPPGAGKGTQAEFISAHFAIPKISTGDLFRHHVALGTPLGVEVKRYLSAGELVPDEVTISMVAERLGEPDAERGFLLDGFPRNVPQAEVLDQLLSESESALDLVLELQVQQDEVIRRLSGRRTCHGCGKIWHVEFDPTSAPGVCDRCGGALFQREDDRPETVRHRLEVYAAQTEPLIGFYSVQEKLVAIEATGPVEQVTERVIAVLDTVRT
jgi:adenylate kinase